MYDLGEDRLTRISAGPAAGADVNVTPSNAASTAALRFVSEDGQRAYFTAAGPIAGAASAAGGITAPGGDPATVDQANLYLYDGGRPLAQRWRFVARLPRSASGSSIAGCATTGRQLRRQVFSTDSTDLEGIVVAANVNCLRGTADGGLVTFATTGRLVEGDPDSASGDVYGFDADGGEIVRVSAPQGGPGQPYTCVTDGPDAGRQCYGVPGFGGDGFPLSVHPGLVVDPQQPGSKTVFFQSKSRLVAGDQDDRYDVYQWRDGELSLLSAGTDRGAYYAGNSSDGQTVFVNTRSVLSWQDRDEVMDIYAARVGGGIEEPPAPPAVCAVLSDSCQSLDGAPAVDGDRRSAGSGGAGNATARARARIAVALLGSRGLRRSARRGVIALRVRATAGGRATVVARARLRSGRGGRLRLRRVGRDRRKVDPGRVTVLRVRLAGSARARLRRARALSVSLVVRMPGARSRSRRVVLRLPGRRPGRSATAASVAGGVR
jgi:hypothetical protein